MKFEIKHHKNGWVLTTEDDEEGVVGVEGNDEDEIDCFARFLREIANSYGPTESRYSPKRIYIRVEPGDKWDPPEGKESELFCDKCHGWLDK